MKTEVKAQKNDLPCDFPTLKHSVNKSNKIQPCTLSFLQRFSDHGHLYAVLARPINIEAYKFPYIYAIKVSDETQAPIILFAFQSDNSWLHAVRYKCSNSGKASITNSLLTAGGALKSKRTSSTSRRSTE